MRPTLRQLQYLVAIAETGKFGDAAKRLHVSQPSLSAQVSDMEDYLGVQLFERGRHGAFMTPVGEDLVRRARIIIRNVEELKEVARQGRGALSGRIQLGVLPSIGPYLLPTATKHLHAMYPDLRLAVRELRTVDLEAELRDGRLDTIISTPEDHDDTGTSLLFGETLWVCAAPDDPLSFERGAISLIDLKGRSLLTLGSGHRLSSIVERLAELAGARVSAEYEGTSLDAVRQMAIMGAGVAVLPSLYALSEARRDPDLIIRKIDHPIARREISLLWRSSSPLSENYGSLAMTLKSVAEQLLQNSINREPIF